MADPLVERKYPFPDDPFGLKVPNTPPDEQGLEYRPSLLPLNGNFPYFHLSFARDSGYHGVRIT
ncbi:MAG: hypothetical protein KGM98_09130 [Bacteroidota bacterium]|nr:hypothetical protein [Bacteroidota bacterium]